MVFQDRKRKKSNICLVPGAGIEPARYLVSRDFKSLASTCSATRAMVGCKKKVSIERIDYLVS